MILVVIFTVQFLSRLLFYNNNLVIKQSWIFLLDLQMLVSSF